MTPVAVALFLLALALVVLGVLALRGSGSARLQALEQSVERLERLLREEAARGREESAGSARSAREETQAAIRGFGESVARHLERIGAVTGAAGQTAREELARSLGRFNDSVVQTLTTLAEAQKREVEALTARLDALKEAVEAKLGAIQEDNGRRLEEMRRTVDEKLQSTLEARLNESFRTVGSQLEQVHRGLGEMQALATGVGDLKKVLSNVKTRGTWGEVQLWALLEQVLGPGQYEADVAPKGGAERVEFAVKLPGRGDDPEAVVWLPIDSKFPIESYLRLLEAQERGVPAAVEAAAEELEAAVKRCAREIADKYVNPPRTTDFAILFLPTEGLFAEVLRRPALVEHLQNRCRIVVAGPTTLWSLLNSLQMGFRTLAIQKRSGEVWNLLAAVKTEWGRYGDLLAKVQRKLQEATDTMSQAAARTRTIGRKLVEVQELPAQEAEALLNLGPGPQVEQDEGAARAAGPPQG